MAQGSAGKTKINIHVQKNTKNKNYNKTSNIGSIVIQNVTTQSINVGDKKNSEEKGKKRKIIDTLTHTNESLLHIKGKAIKHTEHKAQPCTEHNTAAVNILRKDNISVNELQVVPEKEKNTKLVNTEVHGTYHEPQFGAHDALVCNEETHLTMCESKICEENIICKDKETEIEVNLVTESIVTSNLRLTEANVNTHNTQTQAHESCVFVKENI